MMGDGNKSCTVALEGGGSLDGVIRYGFGE